MNNVLLKTLVALILQSFSLVRRVEVAIERKSGKLNDNI